MTKTEKHRRMVLRCVAVANQRDAGRPLSEIAAEYGWGLDHARARIRWGREIRDFTRVKQMIYSVTIQAPPINEEVVLAADSEEEAKEKAVYSALQRQAKAATVRVMEAPDATLREE